MKNEFGPRSGLHVYLMGKGYAEKWTRNAYNVPEGVLLGWRPYRVIVQSYGATAYTAFDSIKDFKRWLGKCKIELGYWRGIGMRSATIVS